MIVPDKTRLIGPAGNSFLFSSEYEISNSKLEMIDILKIDFNDEIPAVLSEPVRGQLLAAWDQNSDVARFLNDSGRRHPPGLQIRDNFLLIAAIEEIRDGYWVLIDEKRKLRLRARQSSAALLAFDQHPDTLDINHDLRNHGYQSYLRLQETGYGFSSDEMDQRLAALPETASLKSAKALLPEHAQFIIEKIVGRAWECYQAVFKKDDLPQKYFIPCKSVAEPPDTKRSQPRKHIIGFENRNITLSIPPTAPSPS